MAYNDDLTELDEVVLDSPLDTLVVEEQEQPDPDLMLELLQSSDRQQQMTAARAFCELKEPRATPHLLLLLDANCPLLRVSVAYALGRNPCASVVEPLVKHLATDWNGYVRKGLVWALGNCSDRRAIQPLLRALQTDIAAVRLWAASSLGQLANLGYDVILPVVPALVDALRNDPIEAVRSNCAWALGQICRELPSNVVYATIIDGLIEALVEDPEMAVREDAKGSLLRVGDARALQMIEELQQDGWLW
ncbi:MAG: HEAT repeat domain-containing protein [Cyanobacteria bacterium P01_H01_bin.121]